MNAHFAEVWRESCNIRFIGPSPRAMSAPWKTKPMSRALAKKAEVPTPPGSEGVVENEKDAAGYCQNALATPC